MSQQVTFHTPQIVSTELEVSAATLRRWSDEFAGFLSDEAGSPAGGSHRRYNEHDVETLGLVKELMGNGMTYEQVRQHLTAEQAIWAEGVTRLSSEKVDDFEDSARRGAEIEVAGLDVEETALIPSNGSDASAVDFINNTLTTLSENQKSVLNSQAANRELLGVLIQDNFNLKEENNQLRQRVLEVERNVTQIRHEDEWRRESLRQELDAKLSQVQQTAVQALSAATAPQPPPDIKAVQSKPGCLGGLFGGGEIKIISAIGRRGQPQAEVGDLPPQGQAPQGPQPPGASHPKPMAPPE